MAPRRMAALVGACVTALVCSGCTLHGESGSASSYSGDATSGPGIKVDHHHYDGYRYVPGPYGPVMVPSSSRYSTYRGDGWQGYTYRQGY